MSYQDLIARLEKATGPDRELDAAIVAFLNSATVKRYPPSDDFGPKDKWQFWSKDGAHFLGNESTPKFKVPHYTASIDAALTLVPDGWTRFVDATAPECLIDVELFAPGTGPLTKGSHRCESIALCIAALKARQALTSAQEASK